MKKQQRQEILLDIIKKNQVGTQEELVSLLIAAGVDATQATVSRDVKDLDLIKKKNKDGKTVYFPAADVSGDSLIFMHSVTGVRTAGHMICIKCMAGSANAVAARFDRLNKPEVIGSIAGDDTIFLLCETENDAKNIKEDILGMIGGK